MGPSNGVLVFGSLLVAFVFLGDTLVAQNHNDTVRLESQWVSLEINSATGRWFFVDKRSGARWPSKGTASPGAAGGLGGGFSKAEVSPDRSLRLLAANGAAIVFELVDGGRALDLRYEGEGLGEVRVLDDLLTATDTEGGYAIVPCREGLLVPADSGKSFRRTFGTSDYEGAHMNMLGFVKASSALIVGWDDAYVFPELRSVLVEDRPFRQRLSTSVSLRQSARTVRLTPLGKGDWNTVASGYRRVAEQKGLAATLRKKIARNPRAELLIGAANVKLWTCLARRMNEESTKEESVRVRWTFAEAAQIAEHLHWDLGIERCLFMMGGWTEGGYDCRHPDNLPANPECGGNQGLTLAIQKIQELGYVGCLHDNYQDMYRDAKSWDPKFIEKRADGSLIKGGRWLGGRAYMVCAPKQLEMARRPQNLPGILELFPAWSYFIDTTYAVGPRECHDPAHPIGRNEDIAWKARLSDYARDLFGLFGSECGREWALPHSDFFEGFVGVSGRYFHSLDPGNLGATVIPFWEMVYHDCQICYGKYGYAAEQAADYVAHHVLCARPLHYHSIPDHLYWKVERSEAERTNGVDARPRVVSVEAVGKRSLRINYAWDVREDLSRSWRVFVHFGTSKDIKFQDDHLPDPPTPAWRKGACIEVGSRTVEVPSSVKDKVVNLYIGLFDPKNIAARAKLPGSDSQRRVLAGRLHLEPAIRFEPVSGRPSADRSVYLRTDRGWAEGLHPLDVFLKNTHEVLGPLHAATAHQLLKRLMFLTPQVRRAIYGEGEDATSVVVNFGLSDAGATSKQGGRVVLPPWGFVVDGSRFAAFYAKRWNGRDYPAGALFTLRALDGRSLSDAWRVRIFHGFGEPTIRWRGTTHDVPREQIIEAGN